MAGVDDVARELGRLFLERRDVKAVQHNDGSYAPDRSKFTLMDLRDHIDGKKTLGHYLLSPENRCRLFAFDLDVKKGTATWVNNEDVEEEFDLRAAFLDHEHWARPLLVAQLNTLAFALARRMYSLYEAPVAAAYSGGKGVHVYCFTGSQDSAIVRDAAMAVLNSFGGRIQPTRGSNFFGIEGYEIEIEVFPKQSNLEGKDLGNLMRLPLGINRKTGERGYFLLLRSAANEFTELDAHSVLVDGALPW